MNPFANKSGAELADTWQLRCLVATKKLQPKLHRVLLQTFFEEYPAVTPNTWDTLLRVLFRDAGVESLGRPLLVGRARVEQSGRVTTEIVDSYGRRCRAALYRTKDDFIGDLRRLADRLKLSDLDRTEMFAAMGKWITADLRIGVHGERLAS